MADDLTVLLSWFANYSNYYSVITVLLCFSGMAIFIFRLNADHIFSSRIIHFQNTSKYDEMCKVNNPFYCELSKQHCSSFNDGVYLRICQTKPVMLYLIWGASINKVFTEFLKESEQLVNELDNLVYMENDSWKIEKLKRLSNNTDVLHVRCPTVLGTGDFGHPSRYKYPLIVIMTEFKNSETQTQESNCNLVKALMTIIHIKDSMATYNTFVIGNYIKLEKGQVFNLQPIFLSTSPESDQYENPSLTDHNDSYNNDTGICVVCQNSPVSHVILPCRHACVCSQCFTCLEKCPMCRGYLERYFTLSEPQSLQSTNEENITQSQTMNFQTRWELWNQRLNEFLGYR